MGWEEKSKTTVENMAVSLAGLEDDGDKVALALLLRSTFTTCV